MGDGRKVFRQCLENFSPTAAQSRKQKEKEMEGQQLADKLYKEWKGKSEAISHFDQALRDALPDEWKQAERLDPELAEYLCDSEFLGPVLKHPLVFGIPYRAVENPRYNYCLQWKRECLAKYAAGRDFSQFIHAHERPFRVHAVEAIIDEHNPSGIEVWTSARIAWQDSENIFQNEYEWRTIFEDWYDDGREAFTDDPYWYDYPEDMQIPVYRGFNIDGREMGMSWTLDKARAKHFARRFADSNGRGSARIAIGRVRRPDCIGLIEGRDEREVVVFPENVDIIRIGNV